MPALAGRAGAAMIDLPVQHNSGADSSADGGVKHVAIAASRSPQRLGKSGGIGVVIDFDAHAIDLRDLRRQRKIAPAREVGRIDDDSRLRVERPGRADSDSADQIVRARCTHPVAGRGINCLGHRGQAVGCGATRSHGIAGLA